MHNVLISMHIPKTGGTSFSRILEGAFEGSLYFDYDWTPDKPRWAETPLGDFSEEEIEAQFATIDCIHGHFDGQKYERLRRVDGINPLYILWVRDPVERAVSSYHFLRSLPQEPLYPWEQDAKSMDIETYFCETNYGSNQMDIQLNGFGLENFSFIGVTERFEESIRLFSDTFMRDSIIKDVPFERRNVERSGSAYDISPVLRKMLELQNFADYSIYQRCISRLESDLRRAEFERSRCLV